MKVTLGKQPDIMSVALCVCHRDRVQAAFFTLSVVNVDLLPFVC